MGNTESKSSEQGEVSLNSFRLLRVVGKGAFGKVRIVERKDSGLTFALKYIRKDEVVRSESVRNIIRERRMLEHLNHPFLCNLRYSFQDAEYIYLVVDLMNGGDLRFHISRKAFTDDCVRFWMAELGCALRYIHTQGIVHRDVKPDNVLLDSEGHVHLADFNVASDFRPGKPLTSRSGTLAYLAPEVFEGHGYYSECDWWSLGVTFYECIYGQRPFDGKGHTALEENICAASPKFFVTKPAVSMLCVSAMASLLEKNRSKRIGATGFDTFTNHPFFQKLDFVALERKEIFPIFVPSSEKANFDATYDLEELLLEEAPLEARARKQKPRAELRDDATQREIREDELHRMMETMFEPFDYTTVTYDVPAATALAGKVPEEHVETITSRSSVRTHPSSPNTPAASPPLLPEKSPARGFVPDNIPSLAGSRQNQSPQADPNANVGTPKSFSRPLPPQRPKAASRSTSKSGGVQMVLDSESSWSALAEQNLSLPADALEGVIAREVKGGSSGMLGFLNRKKGRERSPKPRDPGVLGKFGARQIIS